MLPVVCARKFTARQLVDALFAVANELFPSVSVISEPTVLGAAPEFSKKIPNW